MPLLKQYLGFLNSTILWKDKTFFELESFDPELKIDKLYDTIQLEIPNFIVLGKRIESFLADYLEHSADYQLLAKNIQIFSGTRTIGEIDFLLKDQRTNQNLHVEVVYKFYVYDPDRSQEQAACWIGPNQKDSLQQKIDKLKNKQLPLLYTNEAVQLLKQSYDLDVQTFKQKVCYFANLFIPLSIKADNLKDINKDCIEGFWIRKKDFTRKDFGNNVYKIPRKENWIVSPASNTKWYSYDHVYDEMDEHLKTKRTPLIWSKKKDEQYQKFFVVWW